MGAPVLACVGLFYLSTASIGYKLRAIADAEHRQAAHEATQVNLESLGIVYRIWRTAEDYANHITVVFRILIIWKYLTEGVELANTASDKLRCLRTKVENDNFLLHIC